MDISVENLSKHYGSGAGRVEVLKDVSFEIAHGEFVAIMGTSGSGKTTLLNIMGGLDRDWSGKAHVGGRALGDLSERALAGMRNANFGFVFQQFHLLEHLNSVENVSLPEFFSSGDKPSGDAALVRARSLLERVGLGNKLDSRPPELSGGQKQRVAIARALFNQPSIMFCDEPTGSLDRETGLQILDLFQSLNATEGMTLVMVTHERHIAAMASRILHVEDGVLVSDGTPAQMFGHEEEE